MSSCSSLSCLKAGRRWRRSREFREAKGSLGWFEAIRRSKDPPSFIVLLENGAAMAGIVVAAAGVFLTHYNRQFDFYGGASILIGLILASTAMLPRLWN